VPGGLQALHQVVFVLGQDLGDHAEIDRVRLVGADLLGAQDGAVDTDLGGGRR
jgi:hypothetical protein